jgi:hypothetical protein
MYKFVGKLLGFVAVIAIDCAMWNYLVAPEWGLDPVKFRVIFPTALIAKSVIAEAGMSLRELK